jgi:hypothetical protein
MACTKACSCPLYQLFGTKPSLQVWTAWYCEGRYQHCARYALCESGLEVPLHLLPNGRSLDVAPEAVGA